METSTVSHRGGGGGGGVVKPLVDDATLHQWTETGAQRIVSKLKHALKAASASDALIAPDSELYRLFYELVWIVVHAKLTRHDVVSVLKDAELPSYPDACDTFLDLVWIIGNEVEANEKGRERHSSAEWQQLCRFVKALADDAVVPAFSLKASLEYDLLHAAGLVSEPQLMRKKLLRINTKALYTQMKYNLLREESEGFAKVLSLVHTNVSPAQLDATQTDLLALIGYFDLDANRVLDLVLDAYEVQPTNDCFATLLGAFKRASLPHVLGFKFQFYKRDASDGLVTPRSLYRLAATLVAKRLVDVDALLPHLAPSRDAIVAQFAARTQALEAAAQAFGKVNLAAKATDSAAESADKRALDDDADEHNQVFGLIAGLLEIGADAQAFELIAWFQRRGVNPLASKALSAQLCASVHALIAPLYAPLSLQTMHLVARTSGSSSSSAKALAAASSAAPVTTSETLVSVVFPILEMLGGQLHHDPLLFTKLLRILSHALERAPKTPSTATADAPTHAQLLARVRTLIVKSFLPAVTHLGSNPSAVFQLWDVVKLYPFEQRYRMYEQWQAAYATDPEMKLVDAQVVQATRKVMRRLTADRAKPSARSLTHFAHANPLTVFRTMLRQIQSYDNLIQPVVESFKFITPLGMDVLSFVLVRELAASRQAMKADGTNVSLWLASLASFAGSFYRKYPTVELSGLLQYLIQRLRNWESVDLVVLSELLSKMGSCISFEDISLSQLEALAGGPHLGHEPTDPKVMNRRAIPRLRDALVKRDLALPLVLLICQMRSRIEHHEGSPQTHLKLLGRVYDTCQMTLSQLLQFLHSVVDPAAYTAMLPSLTALVREYHIQPELAMTLCRPAMRSDDPVLRRAPRSIHASGASSSNSSSTETPARWCIDAPELLADVRAAVLTSPDGAADSAFSGMTPDLYVTFWSLVLYDIYVPFAQYEAEIVRLRTSLTAPGGVNNATLTSTERKKLKEKTTQRIDKLTHEQKDQVAHRKRVFERLDTAKRAFFAREDTNRSAVHALLQTCVIPRALLSPEDALFCAKFMERLHAIDTPEFSTLQYYNTVNLKLPSIVLCVTEREAGNFGIFLKETLHVLARWYQSAVAYEEDAVHGKSGFSVDLHDPTKTLPHRQYKLVFAKWHKWMAKVFAATLASSEYMPMRNTLIVLTKVIDVFPASKSTAERLLAIVEGLTKEDREDIKIMAKRYFALLTKRKGTLVEDKLLAVATPKKMPAATAAAPAVTASGKDASSAPVDDDRRDSKDAAADPAKASLRASASAASDAPKTTASEASSRDRKPARVLRQDLESGEISTPPPSTSSSAAPASSSSSGPPAGRSSSSSSSSRRSSERPSSTGAPAATESARERENRPSSSSGSRLKRRDSDRTDESAASSGRPGDEKRGRREPGRDGREPREGREASPGKPPLASSGNSNARGTGADAPASGGRKRDRSRERRSRSSDGRRNGRERSDAANANAPASSAPVASASKEMSAASGSAGRASDAPKRESEDASSESRKRQRLELSEAQLRRQLTEKRDQEQRRERMDASAKSDGPAAARSSESSGPAARSGGDAERSERPPTASSSSSSAPAGSSVRKMVSLVSTSRKREDDGDRAGATPTEAAVAVAVMIAAVVAKDGAATADVATADVATVEVAATTTATAAVVVAAVVMIAVAGSQRVGMAQELLENWPRIVKDVLDEASEAADVNLLTLLRDGPQDKLTQTAVAQPAILAHSIAVLRVLQHESGFDVQSRAAFVLGHSLGEYSALVAAKSLAFADAIKLVRFRGTVMQAAVAPGVGAMAALMPVSAHDADEICRLAAEQTERVCQVANYNSSKQSVISGDAAAVAAAIEIAKTEKRVRRAVPLDVSAPFHCALMAPAAAQLRAFLTEHAAMLRAPQTPVVWNVEARASEKRSATELVDVLTEQVTRPVQWSASIDACLASGVDDFVELGYGGVLTGLIKQHAPKASARSCGTAEQIRTFLRE